MNANGFLVGGLILFSTALYADEASKITEFQRLDASGNGYVTVMEAQGNIELLRKWVEVDANTDGMLDVSEFSAFEVTGTFEPRIDDDEPGLGAAPTEE